MRGSDLLVRALCRTLQARTREPVELLETHVSWVLLAGEHAYKLKKPVRLPFVDYGSAEARHRFCEEELRLNRRLAPSLYLGVSRVTGPPQEPELDGDGPVIDHAVRMRRFPPGALFAERLAAGTLGAPEIDSLAALLAQFHDGAPRADAASGFGSAVARRAAALATVGALAASVPRPEHAELRAWLEGTRPSSRRCGRNARRRAGCASATATCTWATCCCSTARWRPSTSSTTSRSRRWTCSRTAGATWRSASSTPGSMAAAITPA